MSLLVPTSYA